MTDPNDHPAVLPPQPPTLRVMPTPADLNANGDIFGGWIMAQTDIAAGIVAMRRSRGRVVTVAVNSFVFKQPVSVGDIVSLYAEVVATGRTSIKVNVEVYAERHPAQPITVKVTEATLTFVAINQQGEKRVLPDVEQ
jgi:acyl-CoA thioesterase YciA